MPESQIKATLAHEFGHLAHKDTDLILVVSVGNLIVMKSSRGNEFEADEFSFNLGYGNDLCILLNSIGNSGAKGLFANLASSHPDKHDRIAKLQELGSTYRTTYGE